MYFLSFKISSGIWKLKYYTLPEVLLVSPVIILKVVDFPAPLVPSKPNTVPGFKPKLIPFNARLYSLLKLSKPYVFEPYIFTKFLTLTEKSYSFLSDSFSSKTSESWMSVLISSCEFGVSSS